MPGIRRRAVLKAGGLLAVLAVTPDAIAETAKALSRAPGRRQPRVLTSRQSRILHVVGDVLIPATTTPGAADAGVSETIERLLLELGSPADRELVKRGLDDFDRRAKETAATGFVEATAATRLALVRAIDGRIAAPSPLQVFLFAPFPSQPATASELASYEAIKRLVVFAFVTSKAYTRIEPTSNARCVGYDACVDLTPADPPVNER